MRDLKYLIGMALVAGFCFTADAANNPDPFNVKRAPVQNVLPSQAAAPAPAVQAAPSEVAAVVVAAPTTMDEIKTWLNTIFAGLIAALLAKIGFRPAPTPVVVPVAEPRKITELLSTIKDTAERADLDEKLLALVQSGLPGRAIQTAAGLAPGGGALAGILEPMLRRVVIEALERKVAQP